MTDLHIGCKVSLSELSQHMFNEPDCVRQEIAVSILSESELYSIETVLEQAVSNRMTQLKTDDPQDAINRSMNIRSAMRVFGARYIPAPENTRLRTWAIHIVE